MTINQPFLNHFNSTNMGSSFGSPSSLTTFNSEKEIPCKLGMVIAPGHGYLSFDCPSVSQDAFGFYPRPVTTQLNILQKGSIRGIGTSENSIRSYQTVGFTTGRVESLQATQKFSAIISPQCSLNTIGTTQTASDYAIQNGPPEGAISVATSALKTGIIGLSDHPQPGMIANEIIYPFLYNCNENPDDCVEFSRQMDPSKVEKAFNFVMDSRINPPRFQTFTHNCLVFAAKTLQHIGEFDSFREELLNQIANKPLSSRITAIAWQYFSWTQ